LDEAAQRVADEAGDGGGGEEGGGGTGAVGVGNPVGEVEEDAGEESGFGEAEEETEGVEGPRAVDEHEADGDDAPGDHDAGDPAAGADALLDEVGGEFEEEVAQEKDGSAEGEDFFGEAGDAGDGDVFHHFEFGDGDIDAVDVVEEVAEDAEGDEAAQAFVDDGGFVWHEGDYRGFRVSCFELGFAKEDPKKSRARARQWDLLL